MQSTPRMSTTEKYDEVESGRMESRYAASRVLHFSAFTVLVIRGLVNFFSAHGFVLLYFLSSDRG